VFLKEATSSAIYGAPKYLYYVKTSAIPGNIPPTTDNTAPNLLFWNTADNIIYRFVANVITPIYRIHDFAVDTYTNYYIATNGNDTTGFGTKERPWRSLYKATQNVTEANSRINIKLGIYLEKNKCNLSVGVSILGEGKSNSIIKTNYSNYASDGLIYLLSSNYNTNGNQLIKDIGFDGLNFASKNCIYINRRGGVSIINCDFKNFYGSAITLWGTNLGETQEEPEIYCENNN